MIVELLSPEGFPYTKGKSDYRVVIVVVVVVVVVFDIICLRVTWNHHL